MKANLPSRLNGFALASIVVASMWQSQACAAAPSFPVTPFTFETQVSNSTPVIFAAEPAKTLGATSITLSNFSTATQEVLVAAFETSGANCTGSVVGLSGQVQAHYLVPAQQTINITFPTPLVIPKLGKGSCIGVQLGTTLNGSFVEVVINGFQQ